MKKRQASQFKMASNSTIKPKTGKCPSCPPTVKDQLLIGGLCAAYHYWESRRKVKSIKPRSDKKVEQDKIYAVLRPQFLKDKSECEAQLPGCTYKAEFVHHKEGRIGYRYLDTTTWLAICGHCHDIINEHSKEAIEKGLSERRNTPLK